MSFTCPRCGMVSHNDTDEREGYCGLCHDFTRVTSRPDELTVDQVASAEANYARARHALMRLVGLVAEHMDENSDDPCPPGCVGTEAPSWLAGMSDRAVRLMMLAALHELGEQEMEARRR